MPASSLKYPGTFTISNAWSWRIPSVVQAAPSVIQLIAIWLAIAPILERGLQTDASRLVPESPRYLIVNFITALTMCFFIDKLGRRPLFLFATGGMCASFVVWTIFAAEFKKTGINALGYLEVTFIFLYYVFYNCAWSGLLVGYAVEILPYKLRAKGLTLMFLAVDLALFFNSYVNPVALAKALFRTAARFHLLVSVY
jgi:hypothetical protein